MKDQLLAKYASLSNKAQAIEAERVALRDEIVKLMIAEGKDKEVTTLGTFTVGHRLIWKYSPALTKAGEQLKIKQMREQDKGVATSIDNPYLLYHGPKVN